MTAFVIPDSGGGIICGGGMIIRSKGMIICSGGMFIRDSALYEKRQEPVSGSLSRFQKTYSTT